MRKQIILSLLMTISCITYAQLDSYDLSTYKVPDVWWHQLTGNFGLDQSYNHIKRDYLNEEFGNADYTRNENQIEGLLDFEYEYFKNTKNYQGYLLTNVNGALSNYKSKLEYQNSDFSDFENDYKQEETNSGINVLSENRYYINPKIFAAGSFLLDVDINKQKATDNLYESNNQNEKYRDVVSEFNLGAGYGRIERVEDARQAILILKKLQKIGKLTHEPTEAEITELAELISTLKNILYFDSRNQKVDELQAVNDWLLQKKLIKEVDGEYFAHLNDMWEYGRQQIRRSGFSIEGGLTVNIRHNYSEYEDDVVEFNLQTIGPYLSISYDKPINIALQHGASIYASYAHNLNDEGLILYAKNYLGASYRFGYYPNTRTNVNTTLGLTYGEYTFPVIPEEDFSNKNIEASLLISGNYYISPQLRLNISCRLSNYFTEIPEIEKNTNIYQYINAGLTYYIF